VTVDRPSKPRAPEEVGAELLRIGLLLAVVAVAVQTVAHLTNEFLLGGRVEGLDADVEGNAFTWASSAATFGLGLVAFLYAVVMLDRRRIFGLLAGIAVFFSLDDAVQVHERLALEIGEDLLGLSDHVAVRLWIVLYLPLLLVAGALLWIVSQQVWSPAGRFVRFGLVALIASVPVEIAGVVTRPIASDGFEAPEHFRIAVEEGLELGGWVLAASGLAAALVVSLMHFRQD